MWLVGDDFLKDSVGMFTAMKNRAVRKGTTKPYLFDWFNISSYHTQLATRGISRTLMPFIEALNENVRLLKYIMMIPDKDMIVAMKNRNFASSQVMGGILHYIIKKMDLLIERRCNDITEICSGALLDNHPKIVWVGMLRRGKSADGKKHEIFSLRRKFNSMLEERLLEARESHHIISIDVPTDEFDLLGNLSPSGKIKFWREIDRDMTKFDNGLITLKPRDFNLLNNSKITETNERSRNSSDNMHLKLPTPPPRTNADRDRYLEHDHRKNEERSPKRKRHERNRSRSRSSRRHRHRNKSRSKERSRSHSHRDQKELHHHSRH